MLIVLKVLIVINRYVHRAGVCAISEPVSSVWSSLCSPSSLFANLPERLLEKKVRSPRLVLNQSALHITVKSFAKTLVASYNLFGFLGLLITSVFAHTSFTISPASMIDHWNMPPLPKLGLEERRLYLLLY